MNGLAPATIVLLCVFVTVLAMVALVQLHLLVKVVTGLDVVALGRATPGFLERATRDIVAGLLNVWEWAVYGVRHASA